MTRPEDPILSSGDDDASAAYIFRARNDHAMHAATQDRDGANLPTDLAGGWDFVVAFALGVREAMPVHLSPEPVLRGIKAQGFYIWFDWSGPKGTSQ